MTFARLLPVIAPLVGIHVSRSNPVGSDLYQKLFQYVPFPLTISGGV